MLVHKISKLKLNEDSAKHWHEYWTYFSSYDGFFCSEINCLEKHELGLLVNRTDNYDDTTYVIPLCKKHALDFNSVDEATFDLAPETILIPHNYSL